mgnify:CR=1 FL=1
MPKWLHPLADGTGYRVHIYAQPNGKKNEILGLHGDALKIRVACPPVDGKANATLLAFIAAYCKVARQQVSLLHGDNSRHKIILIKTSHNPFNLSLL